MTITFKQHVPDFIRDIPPLKYVVETTEELLECPWIANAQSNTLWTFDRYSQTRCIDGPIFLLAEYHDDQGRHYSVTLGELNTWVGLPQWRP
jgi:hypothetical protein